MYEKYKMSLISLGLLIISVMCHFIRLNLMISNSIIAFCLRIIDTNFINILVLIIALNIKTYIDIKTEKRKVDKLDGE